MMSSEYIIEVSETNFQNEVLAYSNKTPVVVDFWAEWCVPCRMLGPLLEKLAEEGQGAFRLAKVDVDENPNLAIRYGVSGIPAVKAFRNGEVVSQFVGAQPEPKVREFLRTLAPSPSDLSLEKGQSLYESGQWAEAEEAYRATLHANPDHSQALLGLAKCLLAQFRASDALVILQEFPASREYSKAQQLLPLAERMADLKLGELELSEEDRLAPAYENTLRLVGRGNVPAAIDGALGLLREEKNYRNGEGHKVLLGMLEMLGEDHPQTREYRNELASLLF